MPKNYIRIVLVVLLAFSAICRVNIGPAAAAADDFLWIQGMPGEDR